MSDTAELLRRGDQLIDIAMLSSEIASLRNQEDPEGEDPATAVADARAAKAVRAAKDHMREIVAALEKAA